jgi:hypothetical protein
VATVESLAAAGDAEQHLILDAVVEIAHQRRYRLRLVALRLIFRAKLKRHAC